MSDILGILQLLQNQQNGMLADRQASYDNRARKDFLTEYIGKKRAPTADVQQVQNNQQVAPNLQGKQMTTGGFGEQGSGALGGGWSPMEKALRMMQSGASDLRGIGGGAFKDMLTSKGGQARAPKTFVGGNEGNPNQKRVYLYGEGKGVRPADAPAYNARKPDNVTMYGGKDEYQSTMNKANGKRMLAIQDRADTATNLAREYRTMADLSEGIYTGTQGEFVQGMRKLGASLGISDELMQSSNKAEMLQMTAANLKLKIRGAKEGGLPGATSNRDLDLLAQASGSLLNTPDGLAYIAEAMDINAQLQRAIADYADSLGPYNSTNRAKVRNQFKDASIMPQRPMPGTKEANKTTGPKKVKTIRWEDM